MSRRVLLIEPDAAGRVVMDRALCAAGYAVASAASIEEVRPLLDAGRVQVALVDERAGAGEVLEEIGALRRRYPTLPVVATGAMLSPRLLLALLRLGVADALPKPFTPTELREATERALARAAPGYDEGLEYAAATDAARRALAAGRLDEAAPALARARAISPFDAEAMALAALLAELGGRDADADRGYRAALALRESEDLAPPDPYEGLARLEAYRGAKPVTALGPAWATAPLWIVTDPATELKEGAPCGDAAPIVVMGVGLTAGGDGDAARGSRASAPSSGAGALFLRSPDPENGAAVPAGAPRNGAAVPAGAPRNGAAVPAGASRAFALLPGPLRVEGLAPVLAALGPGPLVAGGATRARLDLDRLAALRDEARTAAPGDGRVASGEQRLRGRGADEPGDEQRLRGRRGADEPGGGEQRPRGGEQRLRGGEPRPRGERGGAL